MTYSVRPGDILANRWEIRNKIGQGAFSQLVLGKSVLDDNEPLVAIKISSLDIDGAVIRWEAEILKAFDVDIIPKFVYLGYHNGCEYLVMELLGGEDMSHLRDRIRNTSPNGLISLEASVYLTLQMFFCIKTLHMKGYVHRDVKPANFVRKTHESTKFCIIDFGIAKLYRGKDGKIKPKREQAEFRGTTMYASPFAHQSQDLCPRDDLYSIMYVFLGFVCGQLPWFEASKNREKPLVASMKQEFLENPSKLIDWVAETTSKAQSPFPSSIPNFPPSAQTNSLKILEHIKALEYESTPDYDLIENLFKDMIGEASLEEVSQSTYNKNGFKWTGGINKLQTLQLNFEKDPKQRLKIYTARLRTFLENLNCHNNVLSQSQSLPNYDPSDLVRTVSTSSSNNNYQGLTKESIASAEANKLETAHDEIYDKLNGMNTARKWQRLVEMIMVDVPTDMWTDELLALLDGVLEKCNGFLDIEFSNEEEDWEEFVTLQKTIYHYQDQAERTRVQKRQRVESSTKTST